MNPLIHKPLTLTVDWLTFRTLNLLHWRHGVRASTPEQLENFAQKWVDRPLADFYAPPANHPIGLNGSPSLQPRCIRFVSPLPCDRMENNQATLDVFQPHPWPDAPCMAILHGFMSASDTGYRIWAKNLNRRGINALFVHLPYHYSRTPLGFISGELAVSADIIRLAEGVRQAVVELRTIVQTLKKLGVPRVGLFGMSYGGWISALATGLGEPVDLLVLLEPIIDMEHVMWECPATRTMRRQLKRNRVAPAQVESLFKLVSPYNMKPQCPGPQMLMLAGEYDRIAPPFAIRRLASLWGAHYRQYRQGHVGYVLQRHGWKDMKKLLLPAFTSSS